MAHPTDTTHEMVREERPRAEDRSLGELFGELTHEMSDLVREEVSLAKTEMSHKAANVGKDVAYMAVGGFVAYAGLLAIVAAVVLIVAHVMPAWLAALIVGIVVAAIGGWMAWMGMSKLKKTSLAPTTTLDTLKEDAQWTKEKAL